jgi:hypothetical protein
MMGFFSCAEIVPPPVLTVLCLVEPLTFSSLRVVYNLFTFTHLLVLLNAFEPELGLLFLCYPPEGALLEISSSSHTRVLSAVHAVYIRGVFLCALLCLDKLTSLCEGSSSGFGYVTMVDWLGSGLGSV